MKLSAQFCSRCPYRFIGSKFNPHPYISEKRRMHICFYNYSFETCCVKLFDFFIYLISSMKYSSNKSYGPK